METGSEEWREDWIQADQLIETAPASAPPCSISTDVHGDMALLSSPPTTPMSQASTRIGPESSVTSDEGKTARRRALERIKQATTSKDVWIFLVAFRILNALSVKTFFQPDEYFQSLEPAWEIAFGANSGAWITWEWKNHLRSSIHPALFAAVYWLSSQVSTLLRLSPKWHAELVIVAPKLLQAVIAATGDYYTWKLGEKVYGAETYEAWAALAITVCSPWQWFASTRTFSNCLEMTLTTAALVYWPWEWSMEAKEEDDDDDDGGLRESLDEDASEHLSKSAIEFWDDVQQVVEGQNNLRICLSLAALACILRPTNILIWICIACFAFFRIISYGKMVHLPWFGTPIWLHVSDLTLFPSSKQRKYSIIREGFICGSIILTISILFDRLYYQTWAFPPFRFLYFNIAQSLAVFYGRNRWDYYFTEGLPILLTTYLPFAAVGVYRSLFPSARSGQYSTNSPASTLISNQLATTSVLVPTFLSLISHKEMRFIYPLLPLLHILAAGPVISFFLPSLPFIHSYHYAPSRQILKRTLLFSLLSLNILIAILASTSHQPGPLSVLSYLRSEHTSQYLSQPPETSQITLSPNSPSTMTVGFLIPCHSTPWRSHLVFPSIKAWALTCEPPLHLDISERSGYLDEADQFYVDPRGWISTNLGRPPPPKKKPGFLQPLWYFSSSWTWLLGNGWLYNRYPQPAPYTTTSDLGYGSKPALLENNNAANRSSSPIKAQATLTEIAKTPFDGHAGPKFWPEYLVFFAQLESTMMQVQASYGGSAYEECWRGWNSWGHDDWRRKGDIVVWCLKGLSKKG